MKKILKLLIIVFAVLVVLIQLYRPERFTTAEVTGNHITKKLNVPPDVEKILKRSCFDCHSNHTTWPWYSNVAPMSWLVINDVNRGRGKMNFSEWGKMSSSKQEIKLDKICEEITDGEMPLKQYLLIHRDAELSQADKDLLCNWANNELKKFENEQEEEKEDKD
jgi:hypothetical protein